MNSNMAWKSSFNKFPELAFFLIEINSLRFISTKFPSNYFAWAVTNFCERL
jgi:hypothetical protein